MEIENIGKTARLISIEGPDSDIKKTQNLSLGKYLTIHGYKVGHISLPCHVNASAGKPLSEVITNGQDTGITLDMASIHRDNNKKKEFLACLNTCINRNSIVLFEHYVEAVLIHQGIKYKNRNQKINFAEWLFHLEYDELKLPRPSEILYLSLPLEITRKNALARAHQKGEPINDLKKYLRDVDIRHKDGIFYAHHFGWNIIDCMDDNRELTAREIHRKILTALGFVTR